MLYTVIRYCCSMLLRCTDRNLPDSDTTLSTRMCMYHGNRLFCRTTQVQKKTSFGNRRDPFLRWTGRYGDGVPHGSAKGPAPPPPMCTCHKCATNQLLQGELPQGWFRTQLPPRGARSRGRSQGAPPTSNAPQRALQQPWFAGGLAVGRLPGTALHPRLKGGPQGMVAGPGSWCGVAAGVCLQHFNTPVACVRVRVWKRGDRGISVDGGLEGFEGLAFWSTTSKTK